MFKNEIKLYFSEFESILEAELREFIKACIIQACFRCLFSWPSINIALIPASCLKKTNFNMAEEREANNEQNNNSNRSRNYANHANNNGNYGNHENRGDADADSFHQRQIILEVAEELKNIGDAFMLSYQDTTNVEF